MRKGRGREAKLSYHGHVLMENRHGLAVGARVTLATGAAEREAAGTLVRRLRPGATSGPTRATTPATSSRRSGPGASPRMSRNTPRTGAVPSAGARRGTRATW
jgi:hypothetical protein